MDLALLFTYIIYDHRIDLANSCGALNSKYDGHEWQKLQGVVAWEDDADLSEAQAYRVRQPERGH
ncbi:hypothetical protein N7530_011820 [Penicillium desertorum]|uniref:Uncharacterized protein n=1 Tax=Penicillium desertorum TaxID=1303715 RepID=A0A9W9WEA5_9EURO|nr:hypothetical protein N7530_011820 [Penicillium desertorum]